LAFTAEAPFPPPPPPPVVLIILLTGYIKTLSNTILDVNVPLPKILNLVLAVFDTTTLYVPTADIPDTYVVTLPTPAPAPSSSILAVCPPGLEITVHVNKYDPVDAVNVELVGRG
jgi:hypothetical protein